MNRALAVNATLALSLLAGCGNAATSVSSRAAIATQPAASSALTLVDLRRDVAAALQANHKLAVRVLWTDHVPATARQSTRGPALAALQASAKDRQQKHLRVRMLHDSYRIISIRLDPSYATATAVVQWNQDVAPSHLDGVRLGRPISLHEPARVLLHRIGSSRRFVIWKVDLVQ